FLSKGAFDRTAGHECSNRFGSIAKLLRGFRHPLDIFRHLRHRQYSSRVHLKIPMPDVVSGTVGRMKQPQPLATGGTCGTEGGASANARLRCCCGAAYIVNAAMIVTRESK